MHKTADMKTISVKNNEFGCTYSLLVGSEEKGRGILEVAAYLACVVSVVFTISQFAQTPLTSSGSAIAPCVACHTTKSDVRAGT
jgi:hypothetical protein